MSDGKRVAVVTGAGSGIGAAVATQLGTRGDLVVAADIDYAAAQRTCEHIDDAVAAAFDVCDATATYTLFDALLADHGRIDVAVACAGIEIIGPAEYFDADDFRRVMEVNVLGSFLTARAAGKAMIDNGIAGSIVLVGSVNSQIAGAGQAAYCASKGGVLMLGRALAVEWAQHGISVNVVGPGLVATPLTAVSLADPVRRESLLRKIPLGHAADPAEIARLIAFVTDVTTSYLTGAFIPIDGGWLAG